MYIACKTICVVYSLVRENKIPEWKETGWKMQRKSRRPKRKGAEGDRYCEGIIISSMLQPPPPYLGSNHCPHPLNGAPSQTFHRSFLQPLLFLARKVDIISSPGTKIVL